MLQCCSECSPAQLLSRCCDPRTQSQRKHAAVLQEANRALRTSQQVWPAGWLRVARTVVDEALALETSTWPAVLTT